MGCVRGSRAVVAAAGAALVSGELLRVAKEHLAELHARQRQLLDASAG